ncbi:hypothetical protein MTO96_011206 [Rhipicephalus appendiculatus]
MPWRYGSHAAGDDDISGMTRNAECADNSGRFTGCLSNVIKRRRARRRQKPPRLSGVPGRLEAAGHDCSRPFRATISACFYQRVTCPQASNGPLQTSAFESLTACSSRGNDDVAHSVRAAPRLWLQRLQAAQVARDLPITSLDAHSHDRPVNHPRGTTVGSGDWKQLCS